MDNIQSVLSPRQIAKFILWIDKNPAVMQMLEALWPHVTPTTQTSPSFYHKGSLSQSTSMQENLSALDDGDGDYSDDMSSGSEN
jgi:hypothetical protein